MKTSAELVHYIDQIDALLATPDKWTKAESARDQGANPVLPRDYRACCWCITGAMIKVTGGDRCKMTTLVCVFMEALERRGIRQPAYCYQFNDHADFDTIKQWISDARNLARTKVIIC